MALIIPGQSGNGTYGNYNGIGGGLSGNGSSSLDELHYNQNYEVDENGIAVINPGGGGGGGGSTTTETVTIKYNTSIGYVEGGNKKEHTITKDSKYTITEDDLPTPVNDEEIPTHVFKCWLTTTGSRKVIVKVGYKFSGTLNLTASWKEVEVETKTDPVVSGYKDKVTKIRYALNKKFVVVICKNDPDDPDGGMYRDKVTVMKVSYVDGYELWSALVEDKTRETYTIKDVKYYNPVWFDIIGKSINGMWIVKDIIKTLAIGDKPSDLTKLDQYRSYNSLYRMTMAGEKKIQIYKCHFLKTDGTFLEVDNTTVGNFSRDTFLYIDDINYMSGCQIVIPYKVDGSGDIIDPTLYNSNNTLPITYHVLNRYIKKVTVSGEDTYVTSYRFVTDPSGKQAFDYVKMLGYRLKIYTKPANETVTRYWNVLQKVISSSDTKLTTWDYVHKDGKIHPDQEDLHWIWPYKDKYRVKVSKSKDRKRIMNLEGEIL